MGISEVPVYVLCGAGALMSSAGANPDVGLKAAVTVMCRSIEDATKSFGKGLGVNHKVVKLHLQSLAARAAQYKAGAGSPFADTPLQLEEIGAGQIAVRIPGM